MAVLKEDAPGGVADLDDRVVVLLVGDDRGSVAGEEGVVGEVEPDSRRGPAARRVGPDRLARVVEDDEAVVSAVGDQQPVAVVGGARASLSRDAESPIGTDDLDVGGGPLPNRLAADEPEATPAHGSAGVCDC